MLQITYYIRSYFLPSTVSSGITKDMKSDLQPASKLQNLIVMRKVNKFAWPKYGVDKTVHSYVSTYWHSLNHKLGQGLTNCDPSGSLSPLCMEELVLPP